MADLTFYTNPQSRGQTVRWMLEEIGATYDVEVLGYGGSDACDNPTPSGGCKGNGAPPSELRKKDDHQSYDPASSVQYVGVGLLSDDQKSKLTPEELSNLAVR